MSINTVKFRSSCIKTLSAVEAEALKSNQHEFNGVAELKELFGPNRVQFQATFSIRGESEVAQSMLTWYDARESHPTRSEFRLYFQSNHVMERASEGDNIIIGFDDKGNVHCELILQENVGHTGNTSGWRTQAGTI